MKTIKKPKVNVAFKKGYDMGHGHAIKNVLGLIDECFKVKDGFACGCCKGWLKELEELKKRINGT